MISSTCTVNKPIAPFTDAVANTRTIDCELAHAFMYT